MNNNYARSPTSGASDKKTPAKVTAKAPIARRKVAKAAKKK